MISKTSIGVIIPAIVVWSLPLSLLVSMQYITNPEFKSITISVIFPLMLSLISRYARFWVSRTAVALSGVFTVLLILILLINQKNKDAISNPQKNKERSGIIYGSIILFFLLSMVFTGVFIEPLYNPANFS